MLSSWYSSTACKANIDGKLTVYFPSRPLNYSVKNSYLIFFSVRSVLCFSGGNTCECMFDFWIMYVSVCVCLLGDKNQIKIFRIYFPFHSIWEEISESIFNPRCKELIKWHFLNEKNYLCWTIFFFYETFSASKNKFNLIF